MKKTDLKPGTVYYYEPRWRGDGPAALLLDAAMWKRERPRHTEDRWTYTRDFHTRSNKPESSNALGDRTQWVTGYLAIIGPSEAADTLKALTLSPADVIGALGREIGGVLPERCELAIVDNRYLTGVYDERVAQIADQKRRELERRDAERRQQRAAVERHNRIAEALNAVLDTPVRLADSWVGGHIALTFGQAEQLAKALGLAVGDDTPKES